jgi:oligoribonuclease NrnB/cAMP/cGMP phosphodiesterase (DHH superfamily)
MIVSITHEHDLDGLGSQAIIQRYFNLNREIHPDEIRCFYAHYIDFVEKVSNILDSESLPSQLIISDIGFNEDFVDLFSVFKNAKKRECKISWFDHHIVDDLTKEKLRNLVHIYSNDTKKCAAEIVKDYYLPDDPIASKIAEFARDTDFRTDIYKLASDLQLIIGFNRGAHNDQNKLRIVELLSQGDFENSWFSSQLKILKKWHEDESTFALNHAKSIPMKSFGKIIISWAKIGGGKIANLLKEKFPEAKARIGVDTRHNEIIIHSDFINCRDFARAFTGGGHKDRAGFKHPQIFEKDNVLNKSFIDDIKETILKQI